MKRFLLPLAALLLISSCRFLGGERISGNGNRQSQSRNITGFTGVLVSGSMDVRVRQESAPSVKIEADDNLFPYIETYLDGNTLVVAAKKGYDLESSKGILVYVSAPVFRELGVSGSGDVRGATNITGSEPLHLQVSGSGEIDLSADVSSLSAQVTGSGSMTLRGSSADFDAGITGSGDIDAYGLQSENVKISISGSGGMKLTANKTLTGSITGSGDVTYRGAARPQVSVTGSGNISGGN